MTPLEVAQKELDDIDRATGLADCDFWKPLYVPKPRTHYACVTSPLRYSYGGATLPVIDAILKETYETVISAATCSTNGLQ